MKLSMSGQEKCYLFYNTSDYLIEVTLWTDLTVYKIGR